MFFSEIIKIKIEIIKAKSTASSLSCIQKKQYLKQPGKNNKDAEK